MTPAAAMPSMESATGVPTNKLGIWVFLASEVMFFTGLIGAYVVLRISHPAWPGPEGRLSVPIGTINTLILICSSTTMVLAHAAIVRAQARATRNWLLATVVLGSAFLVIKGFEYAAKFHHGIVPSTTIFWACYFVLTGFHGVHVLGGVLVNVWLFLKAAAGRLPSEKAYLVELSGLYWHFVDIVWIFLFPLLYLFSSA